MVGLQYLNSEPSLIVCHALIYKCRSEAIYDGTESKLVQSSDFHKAIIELATENSKGYEPSLQILTLEQFYN